MLALRCVRIAVVCWVLVTCAPAGWAREIVVRETGEAAARQPMVAFELRDGASGRALAAGRGDLEELVGTLPSVAILDTGASAHILSSGTAERLGVGSEPGARYVEVGMAGEHAMGVSRAYGLALVTASGLAAADATGGGRRGAPRRGREGAGRSIVVGAQRFLLNDAPSGLATLLTAPGAAADVVGMPAIRETVVELVPGEGGPLTGVDVRLHARDEAVPAEVWVPLALDDFNRRHHPRNRGALPSLATNPLVRGVRATAGRATTRGDWLLDSGAAVTILSTAAARALDLVDARGTPLRQPDFSVPVSGISGGQRQMPGFRIDRIEIDGGGDTLVFAHPAVVVHDVSTTRDDGTSVTLAGILGMNLLLPSGSGPSLMGFAAPRPAPFARVVIDVPRARLGFALRR